MGMSEGQQVFQLQHVLSVENIQLSARSQANNRQIIALVTQNGDLILYYINGEAPAVLRRVPWFLEREKRITSLAFHPAGSWLLITGWDGFLHIVPALSLVDPKSVSDQSWNPLDLTSFPAVTTSPPTCCVWWQSTALGHQMGLVGTELGDIALINLNTGQRVGTRKISGSLSMLHVCHDNSDSAYLLMTCEDRQQWRVLLEDRDGSWFWPEEPGKSTNRAQLREDINGLSPAPSTRSRLQGLKQMSVEKIAIIRQKLAETRSKTTTSSLSTNSNVTSRRGSSSSDGSARSSEASSTPSANIVTQVENLRWVVNAFLWPQTLRGRQVLSAYHAQSSFVSMYKIEDLEQPPAYGHKLLFPCRDMLVTERFLYLTDTTAKRFAVVSSKLSECRRHDDLEQSPESVVDLFEFSGEERIVALYKVSHSRVFHNSTIPVVSASGSGVKSSKYMPSESAAAKSTNEAPKSHEQWLEQEVEKLRGQPVDTCILVTSHGVYHVVLRHCPVKKVLNHLLAGVEPDKAGQLLCAESLARMFGLDLQKLLELAGDIQLHKGNYIKAIELFKLARCRQIKWIVKLAAGGHSSQLLVALQEGALNSSQEANPLERCQLSNLAVLCQAQQYLATQSTEIFSGFLKFLKLNQHYDELMAINIFGQNHLWSLLNELACYRGLLPEVLEAQAKMMSHALSDHENAHKQQKLLMISQSGFWECVSEGCLREAFLQRPQLVRIHSSFVKSCLGLLDLNILKRLAALYDPTDPALRPGLLQLFRSNRSREGSNERELSLSFDSASISSYSSDFIETSATSENVSVMEEIVMTFLLILLQICHKSHDCVYRPDLAANVIRLPKKISDTALPQGVEVLSLVTCELAAGYGHGALVRNSGLFTWGRNVQGSLGIGPSMTRLSQPRPILTFNSLRTRVLSVACGQNHTLALTENGLYSWGSSMYGQLGLGNIYQSPYPRLITALLDYRIVAVAAGQYHSLALTSTGRVFTWGWGVHGQLGHGSVENYSIPSVVFAFEGQVVSAVGGGHAHSLFLLSSGQVFGCGSSVFGQLGTGSNSKSSLPVPVCNLPESITNIATGYFHNLAISKSNRLYTWGSSPQVLRMQAQAQKKARMLLQQQLLQQQQQQIQTKRDESKESILSPSKEPLVSQLEEKDLKSAGLEKESNEDSPDDQFQIITLKDCEDTSEDNCENPNVPNGFVMASTVEKLDPVISVASKCMNNVRLNGPQEKFDDPLNASSIFPATETISVEISSVDTDSTLENKNGLGGLDKSILPIPDLLAEAVPKVVVDLVQTSTPAVVSAPSAEVVTVPSFNADAETSQIHLLPVLVDTSLVEGLIAEVACGCHHSALVTEEGRVYTWGRNIDGQLGHSGRKEAVIPTLVPDIRAAQIACGADFTLALHADGQVFGWGSNATAQVGRMPQKEPNKGLEGKTIMLSTSKRVIKIPNSANNRVENPQEILGIPPSSPTPAYSSATLSAAPAAVWATELGTLEKPPYGSLTLHWALHRFFPYCNHTALLQKSLQHGNLQAAGRLALLAKDISASLGYHLDAFILSWKQNLGLNVNIDGSSQEKTVAGNQTNQVQSKICAKASSNDSLEHTSSTATLTDENGGSSHTNNSTDNSEMHAFAVQGGNEEMSEGTDSEHTKSNQQPSDETSSLASVSLDDQDVSIAKSGSALEVDGINELSEKTVDPPIVTVVHSEKDGLVCEIFHLIELHLNMVEEEDQDESVIPLLLKKVVSFWIREGLASSILEDLISKHWDELSYHVAVLLFCSDFVGKEKIMESLSTSFMIKLCSSMVTLTKTKGDCPELNAVLTSLMSQRHLWKQSNEISPSIDQIVEQMTYGAVADQALHIEPIHDSLDNNNIVAFSCGHQLNWHDYNAEVAAARTEGSVLGMVLSDGEDVVYQHACPSCVALYLQRIKL
ncbi:Ultraviolet-B receptor UVR8 [Frankliniella fusca]|uniref:Ultraviolet-B receptor UVR8 n=1 Tax=Frankliniella fusca TaxID=407009 RepID=A0AAE1LMT2_9NEOP|nr:Ultraviolet-B receptor UVR8 [Frankliniella fusca]